MSKSVKTVGQSIKKSVESLLPRGVDIVTVALVIAVIALLYVLSDSNKKVIEGSTAQTDYGITDLGDLDRGSVNVFKKDYCFDKNGAIPSPPIEDSSNCTGNNIFVAEGQYCSDDFCERNESDLAQGYECDTANTDTDFKFNDDTYHPCRIKASSGSVKGVKESDYKLTQKTPGKNVNCANISDSTGIRGCFDEAKYNKFDTFIYPGANKYQLYKDLNFNGKSTPDPKKSNLVYALGLKEGKTLKNPTNGDNKISKGLFKNIKAVYDKCKEDWENFGSETLYSYNGGEPILVMDGGGDPTIVCSNSIVDSEGGFRAGRGQACKKNITEEECSVCELSELKLPEFKEGDSYAAHAFLVLKNGLGITLDTTCRPGTADNGTFSCPLTLPEAYYNKGVTAVSNVLPAGSTFTLDTCPDKKDDDDDSDD